MLVDRAQSLAEAFEDIEVKKLGAGTHEKLHGLMDKLYDEIYKQ